MISTEVTTVAERLRLVMRRGSKLPDVKEKKPSCTFSTALLPPPSTLIVPLLPPLLLNHSLSVSLSLLTHSDAHTQKRGENQRGRRRRHNGDILPTWALRHPVNSHCKRARVWVCESVCGGACGCVSEWVTLCRERGNKKASGEESDLGLEERRTTEWEEADVQQLLQLLLPLLWLLATACLSS